MAAGSYQTIHLFVNSFLRPKPYHVARPTLVFSSSIKRIGGGLRLGPRRRKPGLTVCFVLEDEKIKAELVTTTTTAVDEEVVEKQIAAARLAEKVARKRSERSTYLVAAVMSSFGITSMAILAVYYRFAWQMEVRAYIARNSPFWSALYLLISCVFCNWFSLGWTWTGRRGSVYWNVRHICSFSWSCRKFLFSFIVNFQFEYRIFSFVMELISGRVVEFQVGMEFWARWAHRALWHASLWHMHEVRNSEFWFSLFRAFGGKDKQIN